MVLALFLMDDLINGYGRCVYSERTQTYMGKVFNGIDQDPSVPNIRKLMQICIEGIPVDSISIK